MSLRASIPTEPQHLYKMEVWIPTSNLPEKLTLTYYLEGKFHYQNGEVDYLVDTWVISRAGLAHKRVQGYEQIFAYFSMGEAFKDEVDALRMSSKRVSKRIDALREELDQYLDHKKFLVDLINARTGNYGRKKDEHV